MLEGRSQGDNKTRPTVCSLFFIHSIQINLSFSINQEERCVSVLGLFWLQNIPMYVEQFFETDNLQKV